jgi:hypothetical protein
MTEVSRRSPRILVRKNTPSETRENWQYIKKSGAKWVRLFFAMLCLIMLIPLMMGIYTKGYFDGTQATRTANTQKESNK